MAEVIPLHTVHDDTRHNTAHLEWRYEVRFSRADGIGQVAGRRDDILEAQTLAAVWRAKPETVEAWVVDRHTEHVANEARAKERKRRYHRERDAGRKR